MSGYIEKHWTNWKKICICSRHVFRSDLQLIAFSCCWCFCRQLVELEAACIPATVCAGLFRWGGRRVFAWIQCYNSRDFSRDPMQIELEHVTHQMHLNFMRRWSLSHAQVTCLAFEMISCLDGEVKVIM